MGIGELMHVFGWSEPIDCLKAEGGLPVPCLCLRRGARLGNVAA